MVIIVGSTGSDHGGGGVGDKKKRKEGKKGRSVLRVVFGPSLVKLASGPHHHSNKTQVTPPADEVFIHGSNTNRDTSIPSVLCDSFFASIYPARLAVQMIEFAADKM